MAERRWHIREKEGNPAEAGTYQVIVTFSFAGARKAEMTERYLADLGEDGNGPDAELDGWIMTGEPETGLAWTEETGSWAGEQVYAWAPLDDIGLPELPEGCSWQN